MVTPPDRLPCVDLTEVELSAQVKLQEQVLDLNLNPSGN